MPNYISPDSLPVHHVLSSRASLLEVSHTSLSTAPGLILLPRHQSAAQRLSTLHRARPSRSTCHTDTSSPHRHQPAAQCSSSHATWEEHILAKIPIYAKNFSPDRHPDPAGQFVTQTSVCCTDTSLLPNALLATHPENNSFSKIINLCQKISHQTVIPDSLPDS